VIPIRKPTLHPISNVHPQGLCRTKRKGKNNPCCNKNNKNSNYPPDHCLSLTALIKASCLETHTPCRYAFLAIPINTSSGVEPSSRTGGGHGRSRGSGTGGTERTICFPQPVVTKIPALRSRNINPDRANHHLDFFFTPHPC
jgi:hypothetical protein